MSRLQVAPVVPASCREDLNSLLSGTLIKGKPFKQRQRFQEPIKEVNNRSQQNPSFGIETMRKPTVKHSKLARLCHENGQSTLRNLH
jgi:hypothetical protein